MKATIRNALQSAARLLRVAKDHFSANSVLSLLVFAAIAFMVWRLEFVDGTLGRVALTALAAAVPLASSAMPTANRWVPTGFTVAMTLFVGVAFAIQLSAIYEWRALGSNIAILVLAFPFMAPLALLARQKRLVGLGLVLLIALMTFAVWDVAFASEDRLAYLLVPLPMVLLVALLWAPLLYLFQHLAERGRDHPMWGPLTECLLMAVVFVPPIVLVFLVHEALGLSEPARNIVAVLIGIVFSSVIAVPLRAFLLVLADLDPRDRPGR